MSEFNNKIMNKLIDVSISVNDLLDKLMKLELAHQKDSPEYTKNLDYLEMVLEYENELYNTIPSDIIEDLIDEFSEDTNKKAVLSELDRFLIDNDLFIRVINRLSDLLVQSENPLFQMAYNHNKSHNELFNYIKDTNINKLIEDNILITDAVRKVLYEQFYNNLLKYDTPELIKYRYQSFNTMTDLNRRIIKSAFSEIEIENYDWLQLVTGIEKTVLDEIITAYLRNIIVQLISLMMNDKDKDQKIATPASLLLQSAINQCDLYLLTHDEKLKKIKSKKI